MILKMSWGALHNRTSYTPSGRFDWNAILKLMDVAEILRSRKVRLTNLNYSALFGGGKEVISYNDPPYIDVEAFYGAKGRLTKDFDHVKFAEDIQSCAQRWLLSYNDDDTLWMLYSDYAIRNIRVTQGMRNRRVRELLISNF
jgi:DNA adenine methylase